MAMHRKFAKTAAKRRGSVTLSLLADILAAALLVFGNYYFLYVSPIQGVGGTSLPLPQVQNHIQPSSYQQMTETGGTTGQVQPLSLRGKFAEHFTNKIEWRYVL